MFLCLLGNHFIWRSSNTWCDTGEPPLDRLNIRSTRDIKQSEMKDQKDLWASVQWVVLFQWHTRIAADECAIWWLTVICQLIHVLMRDPDTAATIPHGCINDPHPSLYQCPWHGHYVLWSHFVTTSPSDGSYWQSHWQSQWRFPLTVAVTVQQAFRAVAGGGPRVVVSTAAFHATVRGSVPGLGGLKEK